MSRMFINNNSCRSTVLQKSLDEITEAPAYILKAVKTNYIYENKVPTNTVDSISYSVVEPETYSFFTVKVKKSVPLVTQQQIEDSDGNVWVRFENATVTPYEVKFGTAKVSIKADDVSIVPDLM